MSVNIGINIQRSPNRINQNLREAGVLGKYPKLLLDFKDEYYLTNGSSKTLANAVTHARSGNAVMTDGYGPELVVNGGFSSSDLSAWSATSNGGDFEISDSRLFVDFNGGGEGIETTATLESGKTYILTYNYERISGIGQFYFDGGYVGVSVNSFNTKGSDSVVLQGNDGVLTFRESSGDDQFTGYLDNVSVREMPVLKWAPHNLFTESENLVDSDWTKSGATATQVTTTLPDGTSGTASRVQDTGGGTVYQTDPVVAGQKYTVAIWAKRNGATDQTFRLFLDGLLASSNLTATEDWQLFEYETTITTGGTVSFGFTDNSSGSDNYDIIFWGAHLYRSDLGGMVDNPDQPLSRASYVPTTSSAVYLPRIGHHVYNGSAWANEGLLAESESRTNILPYSQDFTNGEWVKTNTATLALDAVGPDGQEDSACTLVDSNAGGTGPVIVREYVNVSASTAYTFSLYVKKSGLSKVMLYHANFTTPADNGWVFDLEDGTFAAYGGTPNSTPTIQEIGNGWYRCAITFTTDSTDTFGELRIYPYGSTVSVDLDGTSSVLIYGAQFEAASTPSSLIPTSGSSVTRAAETFTIPSANLPWPEPNYIGSELVTNGDGSTTTGWDAQFSNATLSTSSGSLVATADASGAYGVSQQLPSMSTGTVLQITATIDVDNASGGAGNFRIATSANLSSGLTTIATTTGTHTFYFVTDAAGPYYIGLVDTASAAGDSMSFDSISIREIDPLSVSIAMDGRITYADGNNAVEARFVYWALDGDNRIQLFLDTSGSIGEIDFYQEASNVADFTESATDALSPDILVPFDIASRHGSTFVNGAVDGVALTANTTPVTLPDLSSTDLNLAYDYMGTISEFRVWDKDITDAGLVEATNPSLEPSLSLTFEGTGTNSFVVNDWSE